MSSLKVTVIGVVMGNGVSTKSGSPKPYQFGNVQYLVPAKPFSNENTNIQRTGKEVKEINFEFGQALFEQFTTIIYPAFLELELNADPDNPQRNIVTDFKVIDQPDAF